MVQNMSTEKTWGVLSMSQKYALVRELLNDKCTEDPPSEPFRSKSTAREILEEMESELSKRVDALGSRRTSKDLAKLSSVYFMLGSLAMEVEELSTGEEYLGKTAALLEDSELHPDLVLTAVSNLNQQGLLWCRRGREERALDYFEKAETLYGEYKESTEVPPTDPWTVFGTPESEAGDRLEKTHTLTLYHLSKVHRAMERHPAAVQYFHGALRRQLESGDYDKIDWAVNSATLSQDLQELSAFEAARHHLAAASYVLNLKWAEAKRLDDQQEQLRQTMCDQSRYWAEYGIDLIESSKDRLEKPSMVVPEEVGELRFPSIDLDVEESRVSCDFLLTFKDARPVFLFAQEELKKAKEFYTLEDHALDYVSIQQKLGQLYLSLAFFQKDRNRKCNLHRKRIEILRTLVGQISPVNHLTEMREIWFELAHAYTILTEIKYRLRREEKIAPCDLSKRRRLLVQGLEAVRCFIESFADIKSGMLPKVFPADWEKSVLQAYFLSGTLYCCISPQQDKGGLLQNYKSAFKIYMFIVEYCVRWPEAMSKISEEYARCLDFINIIPYMILSTSEEILELHLKAK